MIDIKLSFPTIEAAVAALTKLSADPGSVAASAVSEMNARTLPVTDTGVLDSPKPKAEKAASLKVAAVSSPPVTAAASPASSPEVSASAPAVDYPTLQKAVFALAGKSRDKAASVAAGLGVKTFKDLPDTRWAEALAAVNAALAEV